jgi:hypothetical protein
MVIVYYKGVLDECFPSLIEAEKHVEQELENDWSKNAEDYVYSL